MITKSFEQVNEIITFVDSCVALSDDVYTVQTSYAADYASLTFLVDKDCEKYASKAFQIYALCDAFVKLKDIPARCEVSEAYPEQVVIWIHEVRG